MASGNLDLPDDLLLSKPAEDTWPGKDQLTSENSIPLSPQWLYAKPTDSKDVRPLSSASSGTLADSIQKDIWRLDGSHDKMEWRKNIGDVDGSRRWREEERETSLLGRRERKKEGDREIEYRKSDRRPDNAPIREAVESRSISSFDRLHDVPNRGVGNESRRDSKWSSRWGPEDKDKELRPEKKVDAEKEDSHVDKNLRPLPVSDSRDKWRPRHRQDVHSSGPSVLRAAPGFGLERDRTEGSNAGFARGRGRSNSVLLKSGRPFAAGPIGSLPVTKAEFRYHRGKLLDIYRKQKLIVSNTIPEGFEEVPPITESSLVTPLAFITLCTEEEVLLQDIWKGKVTRCEVSLHQESVARSDEIGICDKGKDLIDKKQSEKETSAVSKELHSDHDDRNDINPLIHLVDPDGLAPEVVAHNVLVNKSVSCDNIKYSEVNVGGVSMLDNSVPSSQLDRLKDIKLVGEVSAISSDVSSKLPDESSPLFDVSFSEESPSTNKLKDNKIEKKLFCPPEELSLYYQDPQGDVQGPFLGDDIISWFEQGFFGIDLPVCLSDVPEGTPFQPLGDIMPFLKRDPHSIPNIHPGEKSEILDTRKNDLSQSCYPSSNANGCFASNNEVLSWNLGHNTHENEAFVESSKDRDFISNDSEVVLYKGRSCDIEKQSGKLANDQSSSLSGVHNTATESGKTSFPNRNAPRENDLNPLGLLWSELEGTQPKLPLSSTIPGTAENMIDNYDYARHASMFTHNQEVSSVSDYTINNDSWSKKYSRNNTSNILESIETNNMSRYEAEPNQIGLEQQLLFQQLQKQQLKQQLHQQHMLAQQNSELVGTFFDQVHGPMHHPVNQQPADDLEHMLKFQFEQQLHLDQLQQRQLHQRQQHLLEHQMQLMHHHLQRHEPQSQQMHLEQLLHQQLLEPNIGPSNIDPHGTNMLDQIIFRQQLMNESQKQSHNISHDSVIERLIHANFGSNLHWQNRNDLLDIIAHSKHRQMPPLEEQQYLLGLQLEQLQQRQLSNSSRNLPGMEEERHIGGVWGVDESGQFVRTAAGPQHNYSARLNQLDLMQTAHGPSFLEHPTHPHRNILSQEVHGTYERGVHPLERSMHMHPGTSPPNLDFINAISRVQGLDAQKHLDQLHASGHLGQQFSSNFHSHQRQISNEFPGVHMDAADSHWSDSARQIPADIMDSCLKHLQIKAEKQRAINMNLSVENPNVWPPTMGNEESSEYRRRELLHQEMVLRSQQPLGLMDDATTFSYEKKDPSWLYTRPASEHSFNLNTDIAGLSSSFSEGSLLLEIGQQQNEQVVNKNLEGSSNNFEPGGRSTVRSGSSMSFEQKHFPSDTDLFGKGKFMNTVGDASIQSLDSSYMKNRERGKMQGLKSSSRIQSALDMQDSGVMQAIGGGREEDNVDKSFKNDLAGAELGFYNHEALIDNAEEMPTNMMYGDDDLTKESDNSILKRTYPHSLSSASSSDLTTSQSAKGKNPYIGSSDEGKQDSAANLASQFSDMSSMPNKKDMRFRHTLSGNDADIIERSFSDMLKSSSTKKAMPELETLDAGPGSKSAKKKGKRGRQIDPSLLGFKVHSNRILMGEIQRPDIN